MEDALIQRIKEVRLANKLNMTQFAIRINSEQKTVNNYLNGKRKLSLEFVESIIRTFGLDANWLLFGTENPNQNNPLENSPLDNEMIDYKVKWIELLEENIISRLSNEKKYRSVSFQFIAESRSQVDALYAELSSHPRVLMIL